MANCTQCGRKLPPFTFSKKICQWCVQHEAAQRGGGEEDARQRVMPAPWVRREASITLTHVIFGANIAVFIAMVAASSAVDDFPFLVSVRLGANYGPYTLSGDWWRLVTYMFLHGGFLHFATNMWALWNMGALCESLYGRWTYAAIYLITGVAGGVASLGWNPDVWSVGASGALFGLTGALIASLYLGEFSVSGISIKGTLSSLVFFAGFNILLGFGFNLFGGALGYIDNACHVGGLITGLALGALIARVAPESDNPLRRFVVLFVVAIAVVGAGLGVQHWRSVSVRYGRAAFENNADRMIAALQKKIQQSPQDASAHYSLAHAYFAKGEFSEGESELQRVLQLQPQNTAARLDLGEVYLNQDRLKEAQEAFAELAKQDPNNVEAHVGLGIALAAQQNHPAAIEEYKTALKLAPKATGVYYRMGASQASLKQYDEAIADFLKERDLSGDQPDVETALADTYQAKGMTQEAQQARNKAEQLKSNQ